MRAFMDKDFLLENENMSRLQFEAVMRSETPLDEPERVPFSAEPEET